VVWWARDPTVHSRERSSRISPKVTGGTNKVGDRSSNTTAGERVQHVAAEKKSKKKKPVLPSDWIPK